MKVQGPPLDADLLSQVALQTHTAVVVTDAAGYTVWVNAAFERMSGYTLEHLRGRKPGEMLQCAATDPAVVSRISARLHQGQSVTGEEVLNLSRDGRPYWVRLDISPIRNAQGDLTHHLSVQSDITRQRAEAEQRQVQAEDALRERERRDVLARLRREFRMPLNSMLGFAQLLRMEATQGGMASMAQRIEHLEAAGVQLLEMLDAMLSAADGERAMLQPVVLWDALNSHLPSEGALADPGPQARQDTVWADPVLLRRVISLAGTLGLTPGRPGVGCRVSLVAEPERRRTGLRFSYARATLASQAMRLDLLRQLVNDMGGTLEVHEGDDASLLVVYLRLAGEGPEATAPAPAPASLPSRPAPDGSRPSWWTTRTDVQGRVLYVEDDPGNVEIVRHALRSRPQVELLVAHTVDDAERVLSREPRLNLLLVDLMLPGRGGQALLELRAATPALSSLPCVVLTSVDDLAQEDIARQLGADDYLVKPLRLERLLNLVDLHLAPAPT